MVWSPFTPEVLADPANGHHHLLRQCPVHRCEDFEPPFYTLSLYDDLETALRDIETFSSQYGQGPRFTDPVGMLCDPPPTLTFGPRGNPGCAGRSESREMDSENRFKDCSIRSS